MSGRLDQRSAQEAVNQLALIGGQGGQRAAEAYNRALAAGLGQNTTVVLTQHFANAERQVRSC